MFSHEVNSSVINHNTQPSQRLQLQPESVKKGGAGGLGAQKRRWEMTGNKVHTGIFEANDGIGGVDEIKAGESMREIGKD